MALIFSVSAFFIKTLLLDEIKVQWHTQPRLWVKIIKMKNTDLTDAVLEILQACKDDAEVDDKWLDKFVRSKNKQSHDANRAVAKRRLMPEYLRLKREEAPLLKSFGIDEALDKKMTELLKAKPRRTASGVATITVLMKPWPCSGNCVFCPNDILMPKSYIHNEPACQRAARWNFDPFMQVTSRLAALHDMGHNIDKIELIVLGGTFSDYKRDYQLWFIKELFRACNEFNTAKLELKPFTQNVPEIQRELDSGNLTYNEAWRKVYSEKEKSDGILQVASEEEVEEQHRINETANSRVVGLVVETRPDEADINELVFMRKLGCTKIQIGIQTLDEEILKSNCREISINKITETLENLRLLGFKSHVHIMANLIGSTPAIDKKVYEQLMNDPRFMPDEVKIYPCCLVKSAHLTKNYEDGSWKPYSEEELLDVVVSNIANTPAHTRISRMIRDISTTDIIAGNKKPNLRQLVEEKLKTQGKSEQVQEMRFREIATEEVLEDDLNLQIVTYETSNTIEHFLQWVTEENKLAGFLRLSLPNQKLISNSCSLIPNSAMIREVHVYGKVAKLHEKTGSAQHLGLGTKLIEKACEIAKNEGFEKINVISAVGTREYYRSLGFFDEELYQAKFLS